MTEPIHCPICGEDGVGKRSNMDYDAVSGYSIGSHWCKGKKRNPGWKLHEVEESEL